MSDIEQNGSKGEKHNIEKETETMPQFTQYREPTQLSSDSESEKTETKEDDSGNVIIEESILTEGISSTATEQKFESFFHKLFFRIEEHNKTISNKIEENNQNINKSLGEINSKIEVGFKELRQETLELNAKLEKKLDKAVADLRKQVNDNAGMCMNTREFFIQEMKERTAKTQENFNVVNEEIVAINRKMIYNDVENKEQIEKISHKVEDCEMKYETCTNAVSKLQDKTSTFEHTIKQLEDKVIHGVHTPSVSLPQTVGSVENAPKFSGYYKDNPMTFLRTIKSYMRGITDEISKLHFIRACLKDYALQWYHMIMDDVIDFKDFESRFTRQYWGQTQQRRIRHDLIFGKYRSGSSRENYVIRKYSFLKYIIPKIEESDIVSQLAAHFDHNVTQTVALQGIETIEELLELVKRLDDIDEKGYNFNGGNVNTNYLHRNNDGNNRNNYNGNRRNNNNYQNTYNPDRRNDGQRKNNSQNYKREDKTYKDDKRIQNIQIEKEKEATTRQNQESRGAIPKESKQKPTNKEWVNAACYSGATSLDF